MRLGHLFVRGSAPLRRGGACDLFHGYDSGSMYPMQSFFPGDHGARVIPVPIPNTEVKTRSGDGTASLGGGRVARCQDFFWIRSAKAGRILFFVPGEVLLKSLAFDRFS